VKPFIPGFRENGVQQSKFIKWAQEAGSQSTFRKPLNWSKEAGV